MDKNLKTPEDIDKLIKRQASDPSFLEGNIFIDKMTGNDKGNCSKVYKKVYYKGSKREK